MKISQVLDTRSKVFFHLHVHAPEHLKTFQKMLFELSINIEIYLLKTVFIVF